MQAFNKVILVGNIVSDPEVKYLSSGMAHVSISLALNSVRGKGAQKKEHVDYIDVAIYDKLAENVAKYRKKGDPILVDGKLAQQRWEDKATGQKRSKVGVIAWSVLFLNRGQKQDRVFNPDDTGAVPSGVSDAFPDAQLVDEGDIPF